MADSGSCTEHGPTTTSRRSSSPSSTRLICARAFSTKVLLSGVSGSSDSRSLGAMSGWELATRVSFVLVIVPLGPVRSYCLVNTGAHGHDRGAQVMISMALHQLFVSFDETYFW